MCKSELHDFLRRLPKAEHVRDLALQRLTPSSTDLNQHLHLEGTLEPELLFRLAERIIIGGPALAACETMVSASPNSTFEPLRQRSNSIARLRDSEMSQQYHGWILGDSLGLLTRR